MAIHLRAVPPSARIIAPAALAALSGGEESRLRFVRSHLRALIHNLSANAAIEDGEALAVFADAALSVIAQGLAGETAGEVLAHRCAALLLERFQASRALRRAILDAPDDDSAEVVA